MNSATARATGALSEWRANWPLVLAAMAGISFPAIATYSLGLFIEPLTHDFGWSRSEISSGLTVFAICGVPLAPVVGAMIDRYGPRRIAVPGAILTALAFAGFGLTSESLWSWLAMWTIFSVLVVSMKATIWTVAVSSVFVRGRGMALAVTLSGVAISQTITPVLTEWLIASYGWRMAYVALGLVWGGAVLALVVPFFKSPADLDPSLRHGAHKAGLSMREALASPAILRIAVAAFFMSCVTVGVAAHNVPILGELGLDRRSAAQIAASVGIAGIVGKLVTGWLFDRSSHPLIGGVGMALFGVGLALLLPSRDPAVILVAMLMMGASSGASLQILVYLTTRYGGLANFGKIFGCVVALVAMGTGVGPLAAGAIFDLSGSYRLVLLIGAPTCVLCGLLLMTLGAFPDLDDEDDGGDAMPVALPPGVPQAA